MDTAVLEQAATHLQQAVALDPGYALAHYALGIVASNLGRYDEARDSFREVIDAADEKRRLVVEATYNLGLAFYHEFQDWANEEAIERFTEVRQQLNGSLDEQRRLLLALAACGLASAYAQRVKPAAQSGAPAGSDDPLALAGNGKIGHVHLLLAALDQHDCLAVIMLLGDIAAAGAISTRCAPGYGSGPVARTRPGAQMACRRATGRHNHQMHHLLAGYDWIDHLIPHCLAIPPNYRWIDTASREDPFRNSTSRPHRAARGCWTRLVAT